MGWTTDPELAELFRVELTERSERLIDGARAMIDGRIDHETTGVMLREGHTIKGTGRVMGFVAISVAGERLEATWRTVQAGERTGTPSLGQALEAVSTQLVPSLSGDPETGSAELADAVAALDEAMMQREPAGIVGYQTADAPRQEAVDHLVQEPDSEYRQSLTPMFETNTEREQPTPDEYRTMAEREPDRHRPLAHAMMASSGTGRSSDLDSSASISTRDVEAIDVNTLGGLIGALEGWDGKDAVTVNAGELYRLIGAAASLRIDVDALCQRLESGAPHDEALSIVRSAALAIREEALQLASAPLSQVMRPLAQLVGYLSRKTEKEITLTIEGGEIEVDRQVSERLTEPLRQLIVNAVEHGVESAYERTAAGKSHIAHLRIVARKVDDVVVIEISDDGRGIDWQAVERTAREDGQLNGPATEAALRSLLFIQGMTTSDTDSELAGEGTGLALLRSVVESLYGSLTLESIDGAGTTIVISVPMSRVLQTAHLVRAAGRQWGIPSSEITQVVAMDSAVIEESGESSELVIDGRPMPLLPLSTALGLQADEGPTAIVVLASPLGPFAVSVAEMIGPREIAARALQPMLGGVHYLTGAAVLGGGEVALILDAGKLLEHAGDGVTPQMHSVLVVDDSIGVREVLGGVLAAEGWLVDVAACMDDALEALQNGNHDAVVVDYDMPDGDGVETATAIKAIRPHIPIVMLSGVASPEDYERARLAGVELCLQKASSEREGLGQTLRNLINNRLMEATQ